MDNWHPEVGTPSEYARFELLKYQTRPVGTQVANLPEYDHSNGLAANDRARLIEKMRGFPFAGTSAPELNGSACTTAPFVLHGDGVFKHPAAAQAGQPENILTKLLTDSPLGMHLLKHLSFRDITTLSALSTRYHRILSSEYMHLFDLSNNADDAFNYLDLTEDEWVEKQSTLPPGMEDIRRGGWAYIYITMTRPISLSGHAATLSNTYRCLKALWNIAPKVKNLVMTRMIWANADVFGALLRCPRFQSLERIVVAGNRLMPLGSEQSLFAAIKDRTEAGMQRVTLEFSPALWRAPNDENRLGDFVVSFSDPGIHIPRAVLCTVLFDTLPTAFEMGYDFHSPSSLYRQMLEHVPLPPLTLPRCISAFLKSRDQYLKKNKSRRRGKGNTSAAALREHLLTDRVFLHDVFAALDEPKKKPQDETLLRRLKCVVTGRVYPAFIGKNIRGLSDDCVNNKLWNHNYMANEHQQRLLNCIVSIGLLRRGTDNPAVGFERLIHVQRQWDGRIFASAQEIGDPLAALQDLHIQDYPTAPIQDYPTIPTHAHFYTPRGVDDAWRAREEADYLDRFELAMEGARWLDRSRYRNCNGKRGPPSPLNLGLPERLTLTAQDWLRPKQVKHANDPSDELDRRGERTLGYPDLPLPQKWYQRTYCWDVLHARWRNVDHVGNWRFLDVHDNDIKRHSRRIDALEHIAGVKGDRTFDHIAQLRQTPTPGDIWAMEHGGAPWVRPIAPRVPVG